MPENTPSGFVPVRVDLDTLNNSPELLQVRTAGNFTSEELAYWDAMGNLTNLNTFLTRDPDAKRAKTSFMQLRPEIQDALVRLNPEAKYAIPDKNLFQKFFEFNNPLLNAVRNPLRSLEKAGMAWTGIVENLALNAFHITNTIVETAKAGLGNDQAFENITNKKWWTDGFNVYNKWNKSGIDMLDEQYNKATGTLARGIIDGKNVLEIFSEYGQIDNDMADAFTKINTPEFQEIIERYGRHKINLGTRITDFAGRFAPVKEKPTALDTLKETLAASIVSLGGLRNVKRNKFGEFVTEKPFATNPDGTPKYGDPSFGLDVAATLFADPLTYMTFGGSSGLKALSAAKTAEEIQKATSGALRIEKVNDLFTNPGFIAKHESFISDINKYRDAFERKDLATASAVRTKIALEHPEYDDDVVIGLLKDSTVKKNGEEVLVTDLDSLKSWFETGEFMNYLINGKINNILYFRESSVAIQTRQRKFINGLRSQLSQAFHGLDKDFRIGNKPENKDIITKWDELEKAVLSPSFRGKSTPEDMLQEITKNEQMLNSIVREKNYTKKDIRRAFGELLARMPEQGGQIFWADALVDKSLNTFRNYARLLTGDRMRAEFLSQLYKKSSVNDRINILYNLDRAWLDSIGATATYKGQELRDAILASRYIHNDYGSITNFLDETSEVFDDFKDVQDLPFGPTQFFHTTEGMTVLPFDSLIKKVFDKLGSTSLERISAATKVKYPDGKYKDFVKKLGYMYYTGSTNAAISRSINQGFSFLLLVPKLGIKAAIDEATVLANVSTPSMLFDFLRGKGRQLTNINTAITADNKSQGIVKELLLNIVGKNPAKFKSAFERKQMQNMQEIEVTFRDPDSGKIITQKEKVTAEEFFGKSPEEMLVRAAISKYGNKLSAEEVEDLIQLYLHDNTAAEAMVASSIGATFSNSMALDINLLKELYGKSPLTEALEAANKQILPKPYKDAYDKLSAADRSLAHYKYFYLLFSKNEKYGINLSEIFFRNRALLNKEDTQNFINQAMRQWGWKEPYPNEKLAKTLNDRFGQTIQLRNAGLSEQEISRSIILTMAKEMRYVFHGGTGYNKKLYDLIYEKHFEDVMSADRAKEISERKMLKREKAGIKEPLSETEQARRINAGKRKSKWSTTVGNITLDEFEQATEGLVLKGPIRTDISFDEVVNLAKQDETIIDDSILKAYVRDTDGKLRPVAALNNLAERSIRAGYEFMDRQVNDMVRSDVYFLKYLEERNKLRANEQIMVDYLVENGSDLETAIIQANGAMVNQARHNAADGMLKYIDNPALRTQLAFNMRVVGRFIRASEDFSKRVMRWIIRHPESIPYRIGHTAHASSGSGVVYDDQDGNKYVVVPNDGVFWQDIAPAIVMLSNPLYAATIGGKAVGSSILNGESILDSPYWGFFKQAEWNQYTLKVSLLNPSYQENAGVYSFTGPNISLPVIGIRNFLMGKAVSSESPGVYNIALGIDDVLLGSVGDDISPLRATIPPSIINYFKAFDGEYKDTQGTIAAYQAISIIQSNDKLSKSPQDFLNAAGEYDPSKAQAYLNEWRIQTANVLAQKAAFNTIFGAPLALGVTDLPNYLRKNGVVTLTKEYGDILRAVLQFNQENGFPIYDPYTVAVSMHAEQRPGKLIFQVPKNLNESKVAINYTRETLTWAVDNKKFLEKFSTAGWIFAPNIGEYDPKVMSYMEAADLVPPNANPFDWNNKKLKEYIENVSVAKQISEYYQYERDAQKLLNDPNNTSRNFAGYRKEVMDNVKAQQQAMLDGNPLLKAVFGRRAFDTVEDLRSKFNELSTITTEKLYPKTVTKETQKLLETMVRSSRELILVAEDSTVPSQYLGNTELEKQLETMYSKYNEIASQNSVLGEAWSAIIKPLLDKVYSTPFRVVKKTGD